MTPPPLQIIFYLSPLIALLFIQIGMMIVIYQFDQRRGAPLKDLLAKLWSSDRREILHLEKLNGFYHLIDRLIDWSGTLMHLTWLPLLLALAGGAYTALLAILLISVCCIIRYACLLNFSRQRIHHFTTPISDDTMGIFTRTTQDWRHFHHRLHVPFIASIIIATASLLIAILWE